MDNVILKKRIMRRIYVIWFLRKLTSPFVFECIGLIVLVIVGSSYISFMDVFRNAYNSSLSSPMSLPRFALDNFKATDTASKSFFAGISSIALFMIGQEILKRRRMPKISNPFNLIINKG